MKRVLGFYKNRYFYSSLILGLGSLFILLLFRYTKSVENRQVESQTQIEAKSIAMNLDLIMANYVLKTQNLEDFLEIKKIKQSSNQQIIHTIFENTIFGSFSVLKNEAPQVTNPTMENLNVKRIFRLVSLNKKIIPTVPTQKLSTEVSRKAISEMIREGDRQKQFFVTFKDKIMYVIINRSREDKNYFYVLSGIAQDLFKEALPKQSAFTITIQQQLDKTFWLVEKNEKNISIQQVKSFEQSQRIHGFGTNYIKLDYETQFSPRDNFEISVYSPKIKNVIDLDRAFLLFFISAMILFISFLVFYLMDRNFRIQELVDSRTKELKIETERSMQATVAKSRFLASISHEIRTPLNIVLGMTDLLEETSLTQTQAHYLQSIRTSGRHLLSLLNDILDMTRIDLKEVIFKPTQVDSLEIISEACIAINEVAANKNLKLYCKISPRLPKKLFIDHARLKQVLINLLMNAVKYTEKGYVELDVDVKENGENTRYLSISVSDTGIGISEDNLDRIFKSFFQVDQKGSNLSKGVGLGLSIVASIVKRLNGDVQVHSVLGEGSQFHVTIPIKDIQSENWSEDYKKKAAPLRSKILFLSADEKASAIMKAYDRELNLDIEFRKSTSEIPTQSAYEFVLLDGELVGKEILLKLSQLVHKKIVIFDFDSVRSSEESVLKEKIETIPHRLFLPHAMLELFEGQQLNIELTKLDSGVATEPVVDLPLSILIVEDDASNRILFQAYLANKKTWTVDYAHNGFSALQDFLETKIYDVMVTDLQMPEMDGFTLLSKLEASHKPKRIVILSADSTEETALRAKQFKVDQFITKPVRKKEFISAIQG